MILLYRFLELGIKLLILFMLIAFERVVGLPILFLTVTIALLLLARSLSRYIVFVFASFLLAIFYQQAFVLSLLIVALFYFGFVFGSQILESNVHRFILLLLLSSLIIFINSGLVVTIGIVIQTVLSVLLSLLFLVKFLFLSYGFLGKKGTGKQSFFK